MRAFGTAQRSDEDLRGLQYLLLATSDAGDAIPGGTGLRKPRRPAIGCGKRSGARVIYYRHVPMERICRNCAYVPPRAIEGLRYLADFSARLSSLADVPLLSR